MTGSDVSDAMRSLWARQTRDEAEARAHLADYRRRMAWQAEAEKRALAANTYRAGSARKGLR